MAWTGKPRTVFYNHEQQHYETHRKDVMLSDEESALLAQIEEGLKEDKNLHRAMTGTRVRKLAAVGVLAILVGFTGIVMGVILNSVLVGVAGFALALFGAWALTKKTEQAAPVAKPQMMGRSVRGAKTSFMQRMENRWEERKHQQ